MASTNPTDIPQGSDIRSLNDILDALQDAERGDSVCVRDILNEVGIRSFAPMILVPALILVSPLSGIFGLPTIGAILIFLITAQKLAGRRQVWLPEVIKSRQVGADKLDRAIGWLRKPCQWIDARTHKRLTYFVSRPANIVTLVTIIGITLIIPFLEVLPMVTSVFATAISLFAIGLLARDGLFTVLGYCQVALSLGLALWLVNMGGG